LTGDGVILGLNGEANGTTKGLVGEITF
jgi:hypothetical protein